MWWIPAFVSWGEMRSRKEVNWEKTTDFEPLGMRARCVRRAWILADVCADGERGFMRRREMRGGGWELL
jgi:hypothetical protein